MSREQPTPLWYRYAELALKITALLSGWIGGMFYMLSQARDYPELKLFVLQFAGLVIVLFYFSLAWGTGIATAVLSGRLNAKPSPRWIRWPMTAMAVILFAYFIVSGSYILRSGVDVLVPKFGDYVAHVQWEVEESQSGRD